MVGGGTGGSALAKRLSDPNEDGTRGPSVLVLEAGYDQINNPLTQNFKQGTWEREDRNMGCFFPGKEDERRGECRSI